MAEQSGKEDGQVSSSDRTEQELPLDTRLLSEAVIELNISRKNVAIYPPGHVQITKSIDRAFANLQKVFEIRAEMTFGVAKDTLFVGKDYLDRKNPIYRDFALSLNQQGIAAVTFMRGLEREELVTFHAIVTTKPDDIIAAGGIQTVVSKAALSHIVIKAIDYGVFHITEEQEIGHSQKKTGEMNAAGLWQDFVTHLQAGTLAKAGQEQGISLKDIGQVDPRELARLLNEKKLDPSLTVQSYDHVIANYVRSTSEKKEHTHEESAAMRSLNNLLKNLTPELRKQFLSVAFQRTAEASPAATEDVLGGLTDGMVIEMLEQANAEGREISPTLTGLLNKLSSVGGAESVGLRQARQDVSAEQQQPEASAEQMRVLFKREQYESYVSPEYAATLKQLSDHQSRAGHAAIEGFPLDEAIASLQDESLDIQINRALLAFIDEEIEDDDYGQFLQKNAAAIPGFLNTENFSPLHDILETLRLHSKTKKSIGIRAMVGNALRIFEDPAFIAQSVDAFSSCPRKKRTAAAGFLLALGPGTIPLLLGQYARDDIAGGNRPLFDLLCRFGNAAVQEAVKRLRDPNPRTVINLLMLIRWGWDASVTPYVRPLLQHKDGRVRQEAVTTLLRFKDPAAVPALREMIISHDPDEASQAIMLAGQFRAATVMDALLSRLKRVPLFETDYVINEEVFVALGEMGDARAVPELEKIARASWSLYPGRIARMKAELYESLERYPLESIAGLLMIGEGSDNARIKRACVKLRKAEKRP